MCINLLVSKYLCSGKQEQDEDLTLESPGVRQRVADLLVNARKNLLWQSYMAIATNDAKVENFLAEKVVANPNELSGARPAAPPTATPADANANTGSNANSNTASASNANAASVSNKVANAPASSKPAPPPAASNRPANANSGR